MPQITEVEIWRGKNGMIQLLEAFRAAPQEFNLAVAIGTTDEGETLLLFTIEDITAAFSPRETRYVIDKLLHHTGGFSCAEDLVSLGHTMQEALDRVPRDKQGLH